MSSLIITEGELLSVVGEPVPGLRLDLRACAVLSRLINRRPDRALIVPDETVPPYTHLVMMNRSVFRVRTEELTEAEADAAGMSRRVTAEEVAKAGLVWSPRRLPATMEPSPGESVDEAIRAGQPGWRWRL
jgi:hypothetical protein